MVFDFFKKLNNKINEDWNSMEPERLHKKAFDFLQKEFGAWPFLSFDSVEKDLKKTEAICQEGGNIYDICWNWYFRSEIMFSGVGGEIIDHRKMLIYDSCKYYYDDKKFALAKSYVELETYIEQFENNIPPQFPFKKLKIIPKNKTSSKIVENSGNKNEGQWKDGKKHVTYTLADGEKYEGQVKDGKQHGSGTYTFANGDKYEGQWKDGKQHGSGTYTFASGNKYEGQWKDGKQHGKGTLTFASGDKYEGQWKDGKQHGKGTYTFSNGEQLVAEWRDGKRQSSEPDVIKANNIQKRNYADGSVYEGEFNNYNEPYGQGTLTYADGGIYEGEFKNNKPNGKGTYIDSKGNVRNGEFKNGDFVS
jgi:hypothetical protein